MQNKELCGNFIDGETIEIKSNDFEAKGGNLLNWINFKHLFG